MFRNLDKSIYRILDATVERIVHQRKPSNMTVQEAATLLSVRGSSSVFAIAQVADMCRQVAHCGDNVTYGKFFLYIFLDIPTITKHLFPFKLVINRNINFSNACTKKCGFCSFSRTGIDQESYWLPQGEIIKRALEASSLDATEVCIQGGGFVVGCI